MLSSPSKARPQARLSGNLSKKSVELLEVFAKMGGPLSREDVHRLRVSTRRLRALFQLGAKSSLFSTEKPLRQIVKSLTNKLGKTRSLDVSLKLWKKRFGSASALKFVETELRKRARRSRRRLQEGLTEKTGKRLRKKIEKLFTPLESHPEPYRLAWTKSCAKAQAEARRSFLRYRRNSDIESLHWLRIRLKQWRYLLEWEPGEPSEARRIEILKSLQDDIGELHDLEVLREFLKKGRLKKQARKAKAETELRAVRRRLKLDVQTGQRTFLTRQRRALGEIFS